MSDKFQFSTDLRAECIVYTDMPDCLFIKNVLDESQEHTLRISFDPYRYKEALKFLDDLSEQIESTMKTVRVRVE